MSDPMKAGEELLQAERHDKHVRAEVLAAFIASVRFGRTINNFAHLPEVVRALEWVVQDLRALQPAAKALEELLREAEVKGLQFALSAAHNEYVDEIIEEVINRRIAELEKARAIKEKP